MKNVIIALVLALTAFTAQANDINNYNVSDKVLAAFENEFGQVNDVKWSLTKDNLVVAKFQQQGQDVKAFFNNDGSLVATAITLQLNQLPLKLRNNFDIKFKAYSILEAFELQTPSGDAYYIKISNDTEEKVLKCSKDGSFEVFSKKTK